MACDLRVPRGDFLFGFLGRPPSVGGHVTHLKAHEVRVANRTRAICWMCAPGESLSYPLRTFSEGVGSNSVTPPRSGERLSRPKCAGSAGSRLVAKRLGGTRRAGLAWTCYRRSCRTVLASTVTDAAAGLGWLRNRSCESDCMVCWISDDHSHCGFCRRGRDLDGDDHGVARLPALDVVQDRRLESAKGRVSSAIRTAGEILAVGSGQQQHPGRLGMPGRFGPLDFDIRTFGESSLTRRRCEATTRTRTRTCTRHDAQVGAGEVLIDPATLSEGN